MFTSPSAVYCIIAAIALSELGFFALANITSISDGVRVCLLIVIGYMLVITLVILNYIKEHHEKVMAKLDKINNHR